MPPLRAFASHLVELQHAVGLSPARIVGNAPPCDERPGAVVHDAPSLVLVHAEMDEVPGEIAGLRNAADDGPADFAGKRVGSTEIIFDFVSEERLHIAEGSRTGAEHI